MHILPSLERLDPARFDTPAILKKLASASRQLAELKGVSSSIPNQGILINTLGLQEAGLRYGRAGAQQVCRTRKACFRRRIARSE